MLTVVLADSANSFDPQRLAEFGVLGIILILILFGYLWAKPAVDQLKADKERAEAQRDALIEVYQAKVIPVLDDTAKKVVPALVSLTAALDEQRREGRDERAELRRAFDDLARDARREK